MAVQSIRTAFAKYPKDLADQRDSLVIGQIWPLTFSDSNRDGIGDIKGATRRLNYISGLCDIVWMSPVYPSPKDGDSGYDRTADRSIAPHLGTLKDLRQFVDKAHELGLKVILDYAPCHTSDQHPDFIKSAARIAPYDKYYVWHSGRPNPEGGRPLPPNNWLNVYDKSAWCWHEERKEYYLNKFLTGVQPALDNNNVDVQNVNIENMKYWMRELRHDGWRIDALPFANHMPLEGLGLNVDQLSNHKWLNGDWPFCRQAWNNQFLDKMMCRPETVGFQKHMRDSLNAYADEMGLPRPFMLAEAIAGKIGGSNSIPVASEYKRYVDACYTEETLFFEYPSADRLRGAIERIENYLPGGKNCNPIGNHDFPRFESRIGGVPREAKRQLRKLMFCLPGDVCFMLGSEELGLKQGYVPNELIQDRIGGRDPERTPAVWKMAAKNAGFSKAEARNLYLPVSAEAYQKAVDVQNGDPDSTLNYMRGLKRWRSMEPALRKGQTIVIDNGGSVLAFLRITKEQTMLCTFNMSGQDAQFTPSDHMDSTILGKLGLTQGQTIRFEAWGSEFFGTRRYDPHHNAQHEQHHNGQSDWSSMSQVASARTKGPYQPRLGTDNTGANPFPGLQTHNL